MSTVLNPYFSPGLDLTQGSIPEQNLIEDLIIESLGIYGVELRYIPRTLISKDDILGEDRLSKFQYQYPIEGYFDQVDNFDGQGYFIQKFGLMVEQSATLQISKRRWNQLISSSGNTILPNRPTEGDLIYFPMVSGLFEIKFVESLNPFYQIGKLYTYKLQVELFQYASEKIDTNVAEIDAIESLYSDDVTFTNNQTTENESYGDNSAFKTQSAVTNWNESNPFGEV